MPDFLWPAASVNHHANNISSYKSILSHCFINVSLSTSKINYIESERVYVPHVVNLFFV